MNRLYICLACRTIHLDLIVKCTCGGLMTCVEYCSKCKVEKIKCPCKKEVYHEQV